MGPQDTCFFSWEKNMPKLSEPLLRNPGQILLLPSSFVGGMPGPSRRKPLLVTQKKAAFWDSIMCAISLFFSLANSPYFSSFFKKGSFSWLGKGEGGGRKMKVEFFFPIPHSFPLPATAGWKFNHHLLIQFCFQLSSFLPLSPHHLLMLQKVGIWEQQQCH